LNKRRQEKASLKKVFPGYVLVKMIMNDESWYVVRNTRGVTGFVGPGSKAVPLTDEEIRAMGVEEFAPVLDYEVGDNVRVVSGPLENFIGIVEENKSGKEKGACFPFRCSEERHLWNLNFTRFRKYSEDVFFKMPNMIFNYK